MRLPTNSDMFFRLQLTPNAILPPRTRTLRPAEDGGWTPANGPILGRDREILLDFCEETGDSCENIEESCSCIPPTTLRALRLRLSLSIEFEADQGTSEASGCGCGVEPALATIYGGSRGAVGAAE
jgi:hypothetical protein